MPVLLKNEADVAASLSNGFKIAGRSVCGGSQADAGASWSVQQQFAGGLRNFYRKVCSSCNSVMAVRLLCAKAAGLLEDKQLEQR